MSKMDTWSESFADMFERVYTRYVPYIYQPYCPLIVTSVYDEPPELDFYVAPIKQVFGSGDFEVEEITLDLFPKGKNLNGDCFDEATEKIAKEHDDYFWPHKNACPLCGSDAYVGFDSVECCRESCANFVWKPGM